MTDKKLLLLRVELSKSIISFERKVEGGYNVFFNNSSGFQEFKGNLNHLYYEFIKEVQENLMELDSLNEGQIYLEMLIHLFELLDEQIGTYPDFVNLHRNTRMVSKTNKRVTCIHTNPDDLNQLLIYFQHQKKIVKKCVKFIQIFKEKCVIQVHLKESSVTSWIDELKDFYPEMTRIKNQMSQMEELSSRIQYLENERAKLHLEYQERQLSLFSSPINFFFESRLECMKDLLVFENKNNIKSCKGVQSHLPDMRNETSFNWKESKAAMVELIYAIYYSNAVNKGDGGIKDLAGKFEQLFEIDLGDIYHVFHELKNRKLEATKFLDNLKESLIRKMQEEDGLK